MWLVVGDKIGDNEQVEIIAEALGWPVERRQLRFKAQYVLGKPSFSASLYHVDRARSDPLEPPWPDLVLTIGRRPLMAASWIREQAQGRPRIVVVGRPREALSHYDIVVSPMHYQVPEAPNVVRLEFPLMRPKVERVAAAAEEWRAHMEALPQPVTALLVGGQTQPFVLDRDVARILLERAAAQTAETGGTLYITTSRRTSDTVAALLEAERPAGSVFYKWGTEGAANPYLGLLAHARHFIVTGDSTSMMIEVASLGRQVHVFELPVRRSPLAWLHSALRRRLHPDAGSGLGRIAGRVLNATVSASYPRDLTALHRRLYARGLAAPLGQPLPKETVGLPDEVAAVVERIRALIPEG